MSNASQPGVSGSRRRERGQSLLEFALVMPILLLLVMGIVDFGMGLRTWITITNSTREAARFAAIHCANGDADAVDVEDRAVASAAGLGLVNSDVTVTNCTAGAAGESVTVEIDFDYSLITPLGGFMSLFGGNMPSAIALSSSADMRME